MNRKKGCCGIIVLVTILGTISIIFGGFLVVNSAINWFGQWTKSIDDEPTGVGFFKSRGGGDYRRIPLIEPYQAISIDGQSWYIQFAPDLKEYGNQVWMTKMGVVERRAIVAYSSAENPHRGDGSADSWYVIIPSEKTEKTFLAEQDFLAYLRAKGITQTNMRDGNDLFDELVQKGYLTWYSGTFQK